MDVAKAAMGQGWPTAAGLWSGDGVSEPSRSEGRMIGRRVLVTFARKSDSPGRAKQKTSAKTRQFGTGIRTTNTKSPVRYQDCLTTRYRDEPPKAIKTKDGGYFKDLSSHGS